MKIRKALFFYNLKPCLAALVLLLTSPLITFADQFGDFTYVDHSSYIEITDYPEAATGDIIVPDTIAGKPVVTIGSLAFYNCTGITSITLPDSLSDIGNDAFSHCTSLTSVSLPDGLFSIGNYAFYYCTSLTSISLPDNLFSMGNYTFYYCTSLTSISLPNTITSLGDGVFFDCGSLALITLPDTIASIGDGVFWGCSSLTSISLPKGITSIGENTFYGCANLSSISLPDILSNIGNNAFAHCVSLASISLPNTLTTIGNYAFSSCPSLASISLPSNITSIGDDAFSYCNDLEIYFLGNAPTLGSSVFYGTPATAYYFSDKTGFTSPIWGGIPSVGMGSQTPAKNWLISYDLPYDTDLQTTYTPTGDPLLLPYALNLPPNMEGAPTLIPAFDSSQNLLATYTFYAGRSDLTYTLQSSADLTSWISTPSNITLSAPDTDGYVTASFPFDKDREFIRINVTQNTP